jgi:hypothetical protein
MSDAIVSGRYDVSSIALEFVGYLQAKSVNGGGLNIGLVGVMAWGLRLQK